MPVSIVVPPFNNLSSDPTQSYVAVVTVDSLITDLTKISGIFVIAHQTAFNYRGESWDAANLALDLLVRCVLHGRVQREADKLRVNAQLTDAVTGNKMWAERYDAGAQVILGLQDRVVGNVVSTLAVNFTAVEIKELVMQDTADLEAFEYLLRGRKGDRDRS